MDTKPAAGRTRHSRGRACPALPLLVLAHQDRERHRQTPLIPVSSAKAAGPCAKRTHGLGGFSVCMGVLGNAWWCRISPRVHILVITPAPAAKMPVFGAFWRRKVTNFCFHTKTRWTQSDQLLLPHKNSLESALVRHHCDKYRSKTLLLGYPTIPRAQLWLRHRM